MQKGCTSQSWAAGFCGGEGEEGHPLHRMPTGQEDIQSRLFLINPLAIFLFSGALFPASTSDLPGPRHLSDAHHQSHHAISPPSPQDIMFLLLFSLPLSLSSHHPQKSLSSGFALNSSGCRSRPLSHANLCIVLGPPALPK